MSTEKIVGQLCFASPSESIELRIGAEREWLLYSMQLTLEQLRGFGALTPVLSKTQV